MWLETIVESVTKLLAEIYLVNIGLMTSSKTVNLRDGVAIQLSIFQKEKKRKKTLQNINTDGELISFFFLLI